MGIMRALTYYMRNDKSSADFTRFMGPINWKLIVQDEPQRAEHRLPRGLREADDGLSI